MQINDAFVYPHLETIPSFTSLSTRGLTTSDPKVLGRHANRSLHLGEFRVLGPSYQIITN